jgi:hypothetical protein
VGMLSSMASCNPASVPLRALATPPRLTAFNVGLSAGGAATIVMILLLIRGEQLVAKM